MANDVKFADLLDGSEELLQHPFFQEKSAPKQHPQHRFTLQIIIVGHALGKAILQALMRFQNPFTKIAIDGLKVVNVERSTAEIIPLLHDNLDNGTKSVILGPSDAVCKTAFDALQFREKPFNVALTQPSAGIDQDKTFSELRIPHLNGLFVLGSQAHLSDYSCIPSERGYRFFRLGALKSELAICEPEIRSSHLFGISLNALKNQEAPSQNLTSPTGFTAEDLCQMAYYAGRSEMNEILSIYDYVRETHDNTLTVNLLATVIWYFMHGLNLRTPMGLPVEADLQKFIIEHKIDGKKLTFLKDEREQKWWLSSPYFKANLTHSMPLISCDYYDYQLAANEQMLSDRLIGWFDLYEKSGESQDVLKANTS